MFYPIITILDAGRGGGEDGCDHDGDSLDDHLYENIFK